MLDYLSEVKIEKLSALRVATYSVAGREPEEEAMDYLNRWIEKNVVEKGLAKGEDLRNFGFDIPIYSYLTEKGYRGYEAWREVPKGVNPSEYIVIKEIQEDVYATLTIKEPFKDPFEKIGKGWKTLMNWVNSGEYRSKFTLNRFCLEEIIHENGIEYMKIYEPVK